MVTTALLSFGKTGRQILSTLLIRFSPESRINKCIEVGFMEISTWLIWSCPCPCCADGNRRSARRITVSESPNLPDIVTILWSTAARSEVTRLASRAFAPLFPSRIAGILTFRSSCGSYREAVQKHATPFPCPSTNGVPYAPHCCHATRRRQSMERTDLRLRASSSSLGLDASSFLPGLPKRENSPRQINLRLFAPEFRTVRRWAISLTNINQTGRLAPKEKGHTMKNQPTLTKVLSSPG